MSRSVWKALPNVQEAIPDVRSGRENLPKSESLFRISGSGPEVLPNGHETLPHTWEWSGDPFWMSGNGWEASLNVRE